MKLYICLTIFIVLVSCKKNEEVDLNPNFGKLDTEFINEFSFNENSYWIYQNQNMTLDSVQLINKELGITSPIPKGGTISSEYIKMKFVNHTSGEEHNHYLYSNTIKYNGGGPWGELGQPIFVYKENGFNGVSEFEHYDSLMVANKMYYDVEVWRLIASTQYQNEFEFDTDFYFCKSIGIIKTISYDTILGTNTIDLLRYRLN